MQEIFYEESSRVINEKSEKIKYNFLLGAGIVCFVLSFVWLLICYYVYDTTKASVLANVILVALPFLVLFVCGILCYKFKNKFCVEYDYTFVTGSVRIAKVVKSVRRFPLYSFECKQIEKVGKFASDTYFNLSANPNVDKDVLVSNVDKSNEKDFFYLYLTLSGEKKLLILECSEKFISYILKFAGKNILEDNYL